MWIAWLACASLFAQGALADPALQTVRIASGLSQPNFVTAPPGDARLFVLERAGVIRIIEAGNLLPTPFLDIHSLVSTTDSFGLFGLAFAPDYATSGLFYVYYTRPDRVSVVARYRVSTDPDIASVPGEIVIEIPRTATDHSGGTIAFSPSDGFLYIAPGDGGGGPYDPSNNAQNPQQLLGKMLRIDVSGGLGTTYSVPPTNPFVADAGTRHEIWAFGLRNPFRWSFDRSTGDLWIADVGQETKEEVDREPAGDPGGRNYGWDSMEGTTCVPLGAVSPQAPPCNDPSLTLPLFEYGHDSNPACSGSVTGGSVYRGAGMPGLTGLYFFADFCMAKIWTLAPGTLELVDRTSELSPSVGGYTIDLIVGFGEDGFGEIHVVDLDGEIFRLPEPAAGTLQGAGLAAVLGLWRRRRRRGVAQTQAMNFASSSDSTRKLVAQLRTMRRP